MSTLPRSIVLPLVLAAAVASAGCYSTTTRMRDVQSASTKRLVRSESGPPPLRGEFVQEGNAVHGLLSWTDACVPEERKTVTTERVEVTAPDSRNTANIALGVIAATLGGIAIARSQSGACDNGACDESQLIGSGVLFITGGAIWAGAAASASQKRPEERVVDKRTEEKVVRGDEPTACAPLSSLEGLQIALSIPGLGRSRGRVDANGAVFLPVDPSRLAEPTVAELIVEDTPERVRPFVPRGTSLGTVRLVPPASADRHAAR